MKTAVVTAVSILLGVCFLFAATGLIFSRIRKRLERHIHTKFDGREIIGATSRVNFFGEKSKGGKQIRGNGALVLTKDEVYFFRALPFKEYVIALKSITNVSLPTSFNGKSVFSKLLCIQYRTGSGSDEMAWAINNPEEWKEAVERQISQITG